MAGRIALLQVMTVFLGWCVKDTPASVEGTVVSCTLVLLAMIGLSAEYVAKAVKGA